MREATTGRSPFVFSAAVLFALALIVSQLTTVADDATTPDCLYSGENSSTFHWRDHQECNADVLKVSDFPEVRETRKMLGLASDQIIFIGCAAAPFEIEPATTTQPYRVRIFYPVKPDLRASELIAPVLHEMGHAYQLSTTGSREKLLASLNNSIERVELGADFLAGLAARRLSMNPGEFETSYFLLGTYNNTNPTYHGAPENRISAFRYGYKAPTGEVESEYKDFQDNEFGQIKHAEELRQ